MASRRVEWSDWTRPGRKYSGELVMIAYRPASVSNASPTAMVIVAASGKFYEVALDRLVDLATEEKRDDD